MKTDSLEVVPAVKPKFFPAYLIFGVSTTKTLCLMRRLLVEMFWYSVPFKSALSNTRPLEKDTERNLATLNSR